jgi:hypothetical protein
VCVCVCVCVCVSALGNVRDIDAQNKSAGNRT